MIADAEAADHATVTADVCMSALYAKLRNIHRTFGTYSNRYTNSARYTKNIELPVPFAEAISNIGVFNIEMTVNIKTIVPTYPEGTENEGCSCEEFPIARYCGILPHMKNAGIPLKSIDIHDTTGTAWWTFKVKHDAPLSLTRLKIRHIRRGWFDIGDDAPFRAFAALCGGPSEEWNEFANIHYP
uniref:Uncharacterized protein n=1 Tax=Nicotiana tabacum TaxID=4097 RepID=A0A1S3YVJ3_TOBAC|nr:PREDICTED: uncharacterized protein LOC107780122 [Nicotiana tabacum]